MRLTNVIYLAFLVLTLGICGLIFRDNFRHQNGDDNLIRDNESLAMSLVRKCESEAWLYFLDHGELFPADFVASGSDSKCTATVPFPYPVATDADVATWQANPMDLSSPIKGYFFKYSVNGASHTKDGCVLYKRFTMTAGPVVYGKTGIRSFLIDRNRDLHATSENRPATANDPVIPEEFRYNPQ
jgi:hypothetical protein